MLVALFFIVGAVLAYTYRDTILPLLLNPLHGQKLVYLTPGGGFSFIFLVSIYAGFALAFPVLLQQLYGFLRPALPQAAQRKTLLIIVSSVLLLVAGVAFGYFIAVPNALTFLYGFADQYVESSLTAESYLNFVVAYTLGIGIVFQIPLLLLLIHTIKPFTPGGLMKSEKWVILIAFIIAAIITPTPDPINQTIIAGPVVAVYQIGVVAVLVSIAKASRRRKAQAREIIEASEQPIAESLETVAEPEETPTTPRLAEVIETTTEPTPSVATPQAIPTQSKVIDGFTRRPLQVPQRPSQPLRPQARPIPRPQPQTAPQPQEQPLQPGPARGFYVDGIIAPRNVAI